MLQLVLPERFTVKVSEPAFDVSYIASRESEIALGAAPCETLNVYVLLPASVMTILPVLEDEPVYTEAVTTTSFTPLVPEEALRVIQEGFEVTDQDFLAETRIVSVSVVVLLVVFV